MHPSNTRTVLALLLLITLSACSRQPIIRTEIVEVRPPIHWTNPTAYPEPTDNALGYLVEDHRADLKAALESCNTDKDEMRLWIEGREHEAVGWGKARAEPE